MDKAKGQRAVRRLGYASLVLTVVFITVTLVSAFVSMGSIDIYLPEGVRAEEYAPDGELVTVRPDPDNQRHMIVDAKGRGDVFLENKDTDGQVHRFEYIRVLPGGMMYNELNGNFSGYQILVPLATGYAVLVTLLFIVSFIIRSRTMLFSYNTLYFAGASLFLLVITSSLAVSAANLIAYPYEHGMNIVYSAITYAGKTFMYISMPVMIVFALSLAVSNLTLIRHEGLSFVNVLGLIMSGLIIASYIIQIFYMDGFMMGSEMEVRIETAVKSIFSTAFAYFEAMLMAAIICGVISVKKRPAYNKTHIIILGCAIAGDGTPLPLLRGRIDRAIRFASEQEKAKGVRAKFVASGGQGADEVISEAESMRNYLVSKGISEDRVLLENKSVSTQENMRFSKEKINADHSDPKIVFSTSNYHILRSGIISENEGLDADGIGCRTKWYFWPNAFVREVVGLLASKWKQHVFWVVFFTLIIAGVIMIMPM